MRTTEPCFVRRTRIFFPTPLHYGAIPELIYRTNATILFGTNTFLQGYARKADPYDFHNVRYIFSGAEKVQESTRRTYADKFGVRVLEGYGVTEASPVISINTPIYNKPGSVGKLLPGVEYKLEAVEGIEQGKKLWIKGNNLMMGYLRYENPGHLEPLKDGWYDTGDIVEVDTEGYITIIGRVKRFAKIGGEMVSLAAIEEMVNKVWPENTHACVSKPDPKKGETLVLFTDKEDADISELREHAKSSGLGEIMIPKEIRYIAQIPVLGTGKPNNVELEKTAREEG